MKCELCRLQVIEIISVLHVIDLLTILRKPYHISANIMQSKILTPYNEQARKIQHAIMSHQKAYCGEPSGMNTYGRQFSFCAVVMVVGPQ